MQEKDVKWVFKYAIAIGVAVGALVMVAVVGISRLF